MLRNTEKFWMMPECHFKHLKQLITNKKHQKMQKYDTKWITKRKLVDRRAKTRRWILSCSTMKVIQVLIWGLSIDYLCVCVCVCVWCVPARSCLTLSDLLDRSLSGSFVQGIFRQEYWSRLLFPAPGDLLGPGMKLGSPASPALAGRSFTTVPPGKS